MRPLKASAHTPTPTLPPSNTVVRIFLIRETFHLIKFVSLVLMVDVFLSPKVFESKEESKNFWAKNLLKEVEKSLRSPKYKNRQFQVLSFRNSQIFEASKNLFGEIFFLQKIILKWKLDCFEDLFSCPCKNDARTDLMKNSRNCKIVFELKFSLCFY